MRIRMKISVAGTFYNNPEGARIGDIVEVSDAEGQRLIDLGYAEVADQRGIPAQFGEERAVLPQTVQENATLERATEVKRRPGRPRKVPT